jgi:hypothetical protein
LLNKCFGTQNVYLFTKNPLESNNFHTSVVWKGERTEGEKEEER